MDTGRLLVSLIHFPVYVLGPGRRVGLWTQGCTIHCKGCMSTHTWEFDESKAMQITELASLLKSFNCSKLTISGGEPFDQASSLLFFLQSIRETFDDILVYTGYRYESILEEHSEILNYIDAIVDSPFIEGLETDYLYKGSENQRLIILNEKLRPQYEEWAKRKKDKLLQISVKNNSIFIIGIPFQKDVESIRKGIEKQVSDLSN